MSEAKANNQVNLSTWHVLEHPKPFVWLYCTRLIAVPVPITTTFRRDQWWSVQNRTILQTIDNFKTVLPPTHLLLTLLFPILPPERRKSKQVSKTLPYISLAYWGIALCHSNKSTRVQRRAGKRKIPKTTKKKKSNPTHKNPHTGFSEGKKKELQQHFVPHFHGNKCHRITGITRPREKEDPLFRQCSSFLCVCPTVLHSFVTSPRE